MFIELQKPGAMIDPHQVQDIFVCGLGDIENVGDGCDRFTLYTCQNIDGAEVHVVVARVVVPQSALPAILYLAARHIGMTLVKAARFVSGTVH
jgi:hypothetical protein